MMWIMDPRLSVVVYHDGKPAGVIVCIPDLNPFMRACRVAAVVDGAVAFPQASPHAAIAPSSSTIR